MMMMSAAFSLWSGRSTGYAGVKKEKDKAKVKLRRKFRKVGGEREEKEKKKVGKIQCTLGAS